MTPGGGQIEVRNLDLPGEVTTVDVALDGSFEATLTGAVSDEYELVAQGVATRLTPRVVSEQPDRAARWRELHPCEDGDPMDPLNVTALHIEGDTLHVDVSHAGGCGEHAYGLCFGEAWEGSNPLGAGFTVLHDAMGDGCEAIEHAELTFDLRPFRAAYEDQTDEGVASLDFSDCILEGDPPGDCSVLYEWSGTPSEAPLDLPEPPASWTVRETDCGFRLRLPEDLVGEDVQGIDSCVAQFEGDACTLSADAGFYSNSLEGVDGASTLLGTVDGREARLITTRDEDEERPYVLGIHFPAISDDPSVAMTLSGRCESEAAREALLPAFGTVRFK